MKIFCFYQCEMVCILVGGGINVFGLGVGKIVISVEVVCEFWFGCMFCIFVVVLINIFGQWQCIFEEQFFFFVEKGLMCLFGMYCKDMENWFFLVVRQKLLGVFIIGWNVMYGGILEDIWCWVFSGCNVLVKELKVIKVVVLKVMKEGMVLLWMWIGIWDFVIFDELYCMVNWYGVLCYVLKCIKVDCWFLLFVMFGGNKLEGLWILFNLVWFDRYLVFYDWVRMYFDFEDKSYYKNGKKVEYQVIGDELIFGGVWCDILVVVCYWIEEVVDQFFLVIECEICILMVLEQEE